MKTCISCQSTKPTTGFSKHSNFKDGLRSECKDCFNIKQKSDPFRFFRKIYATQKSSSIKRGHPAPPYTLEDLIAWADSQPHLPGIWQAYQDANQPRNLAPSIDRIDSNLPYTIDNLELVTWEENDLRGNRDIKLGVKITQHKAVSAFNLNGSLHKTYISLHQAARDVKGYPTTIQRVADKTIVTKPNGKTTVLQKTKGFLWEWA